MAEAKSFEEGLKRLEEIAAALDRPDVPLAEALAMTREAAGLAKFCEEQLSNAEGRLDELVKAAGGGVEARPLDLDE